MLQIILVLLLVYRVVPFFIYHSPHVCFMNSQVVEQKKMSFSDMIETRSLEIEPIWNSKINTVLAHPSGRIPSLSAAVGWQPIHIPGVSKLPEPQSSTIRGLVRRVRIHRGEA
jgi:hypothetical protein